MERTGKAQELFEKAEKLRNNQNYEEAIAEYSEVIKLLPNDAESFEWRGDCYRKLEQPENALADYNKAISLEPEGDHHFGRAFVYILLGDFKKAADDIEKMIKQCPPEDLGYRLYRFASDIYKLTGNKREAAVYYKKISAKDSRYFEWAKEDLANMGM
jgi:tetratricopeptide (TPR) repeat protein